MKKKAFCALALALLLLLSACGEGIPEEPAPAATLPTAAAETLPAPTEAEEPPLPAVKVNVTMADIDAMPVANASMTEDELRAICVRYMQLEKEIEWCVDADASYACDWTSNADRNGQLTVHRGVIYRGMPYTGAHSNLECFLDFIDPETGAVALRGENPEKVNLFGNTCNTSCYWAWSRVTTAFRYVGLSKMTAKYNCVPLGPYDDLGAGEYTGTYQTKKICEANGEQVMFESYALMKPATGMVTKADTNVGHVRMVRDAAVTVRNADGTVNGDESYVVCLEQTSILKDREGANGAVLAYSGEDNRITFRRLYDTGYVPFEMPELCGKAEVKEAEIAFSAKDTSTFAALLNGKVKSNYALSRLEGIVTDAAGNEVHRCHAANRVTTFDQMYVSTLFRLRADNAPLAKGETYHVRILARLANGETFTAFEGDCVY